jgi:hypothetical protein
MFKCQVCNTHKPVASIVDQTCACMICSPCATSHVEQVLSERVRDSTSTASVGWCKGESAWYTDRDGQRVQATVVSVDTTIYPPQYEIQLPGREATRFTVASRLTSSTMAAVGKWFCQLSAAMGSAGWTSVCM